jgi:nitroreductase
MNTLDAILARRAVKHYDPAFVMPTADEAKIFEMAKNSPTSFNIQNWRFVNVKDKALRTEIRKAAWDQAQVTDASLLIVLCADLKAWDKNPERYWSNAPKPVQDFLVPLIKPFYEGKEQLQRDEAMRSVGIAAQTIMLAAKAMGYDSCPMIGFDPTAVAALIRLPADHAVGMMITVGKAVTPAHPKGGFLPLSEIVIENHF